MKRYFLIAFVLLSLVGCKNPTPCGIPILPVRSTVDERPVVNLPLSLRQSNWEENRQGSCCWATMISLLRWQGRPATASWIKRNYGGGEWPDQMARKLDAANIRYVYTVKGNVDFLEWATQSGRGCGITVSGGTHMVALVHLDNKWAAVLDNNNVKKYIWIPRETLLAEWEASYGWSITPVYGACPPLPNKNEYPHYPLFQKEEMR